MTVTKSCYTDLGLVVATLELLSLAPVLPLVARLELLLLLPPPGPGPLLPSPNRSRHFFINDLARPARSLSEVFFLNWLMVFPNLVI